MFILHIDDIVKSFTTFTLHPCFLFLHPSIPPEVAPQLCRAKRGGLASERWLGVVVAVVTFSSRDFGEESGAANERRK